MDKSTNDRRLADWLDGEIANDEARELLTCLRGDREFRDAAAKHLVVQRILAQQTIPPGDFTAQVTSLLNEERNVESLAGGVISKLQRRKRKQRRWLWGSFSVAVTIILLLSVSLVLKPAPIAAIRVVAAEGIGTLDIDRLDRGEVIELQRGILELELNGDARVVFEAPTNFSVVSARHVRLLHGRCFVEMDEGRSGLRVETPSGEAFDLGTRFAVEVTAPEKMEVHVFDGAVEVSDARSTTRLLEGQGVLLDESHDRKKLVARPGQFVSRVPRPVETSEPFLYWSFDEGDGNQVAASGGAKDISAGDGVLLAETPDDSGPEFVPGVSGTALEFDGRSRWVSTKHPGIAGDQDRTVAGWIKLPADWGGDDKAPIMSWGLKREGIDGQAWMLSIGRYYKQKPMVLGRLRLSVGGQFVIGSTDLRDGRWHHVAAVAMHGFDEPTVLLYVDGQLENVTRNTIESVETETAGEGAMPIRFGRQIFFDHVFMRGSLDEFYVLEGALSGNQIRNLMRKANQERGRKSQTQARDIDGDAQE